jgi:hypothetical protein
MEGPSGLDMSDRIEVKQGRSKLRLKIKRVCFVGCAIPARSKAAAGGTAGITRLSCWTELKWSQRFAAFIQ